MTLTELFAGFFDARPSSLLVRGAPGAGKTTLCLELLRLFSDRFAGCYISTRVSIRKLEAQYPWLKNSAQLISSENQDSLAVTADGGEQQKDMRFGSLSSLIGEVLEKASKKNALIVLDSWDSIAKEYSYEEKIRSEKSVTAIAEAHDSTLVFTSEEPESNTLAYIADGIVTLGFDSLNYQKIRSMTIDKMRGTEIPTHHVLFSLVGSRFTILPRVAVPQLGQRQVFPARSICHPDYVSTGNSHLDAALGGGMRKGSVVLLQLDHEINRISIALILANMILNNLRTGNPSMVISTPDRSPRSVLRYIEPFVEEKEMDGFRLYSHEPDDSVPQIRPLKDSLQQNFENCSEDYATIKRRYGGKSTLVLTYDLGLNEIKYFDRITELESRVIDVARKVRSSRDILVLLNRTGSHSLTLSKTLSDVHLHISEIDGVPLVSILKPPASIKTYALTVESGEYPAYSLMKIS